MFTLCYLHITGQVFASKILDSLCHGEIIQDAFSFQLPMNVGWQADVELLHWMSVLCLCLGHGIHIPEELVGARFRAD